MPDTMLLDGLLWIRALRTLTVVDVSFETLWPLMEPPRIWRESLLINGNCMSSFGDTPYRTGLLLIVGEIQKCFSFFFLRPVVMSDLECWTLDSGTNEKCCKSWQLPSACQAVKCRQGYRGGKNKSELFDIRWLRYWWPLDHEGPNLGFVSSGYSFDGCDLWIYVQCTMYVQCTYHLMSVTLIVTLLIHCHDILVHDL